MFEGEMARFGRLSVESRNHLYFISIVRLANGPDLITTERANKEGIPDGSLHHHWSTMRRSFVDILHDNPDQRIKYVAHVIDVMGDRSYVFQNGESESMCEFMRHLLC